MLKCTNCKHLDPRSFAGGVVHWVCGYSFDPYISFEDYPTNIECKRPEPPEQIITVEINEFLKDVYGLCINQHRRLINQKNLYSSHESELDSEILDNIDRAISCLEDLLIDKFNLSWPDIKYLRIEACLSTRQIDKG